MNELHINRRVISHISDSKGLIDNNDEYYLDGVRKFAGCVWSGRQTERGRGALTWF